MSCCQSARTVLKNATVVDGTGAPAYKADVWVTDGVISAIRPCSAQACCTESEGISVLDCSGLTLTPGFIDIHNHSDISPYLDPSAKNYITQGVTTVLVGHCGHSAAPANPKSKWPLDNVEIPDKWQTFGEYLDSIGSLKKTINMACLVGHGQVRQVVIGPGPEAPTNAQLDEMKAHVKEAMEAGAFGLSTGLIYAPGMYASIVELTELARVSGQYSGLYVTHLRSEADLMVDALMEAITIGRESKSRVQVAHHKASGRRNWGLVKTTLDIMEYARKTGVEVTCDVYPYTPSGAGVFSIVPGWARVAGRDGLAALLRDPEKVRKLRDDLLHPSLEWENILFDAGFDGLLICQCAAHPEYQGKTMASLASELGMEPMDLLIQWAKTGVDASFAAGGMSEEDMRYVLKHRLSMVCSDSSVVVHGRGCPHPRNYATFTRALATYVRDEEVLGLEEAVYKMSGFPAWKLGLHDRGVIKPGAKADIAVFDYWLLNTKAEFGNPHHYSEGMVHVLVNGQLVMKDGKMTNARPGQVLRRQ